MAKRDKSKEEHLSELEKRQKRLDKAKVGLPASGKKRPRKRASFHSPADDVLRESAGHYRSLVELSPDAVAIHCEGQYVYVNPAGVKLFGANNAHGIIGRKVLDLVHPEFREIVQERIRQTYEQRKRTPLREVRILRLDGETADVEVTAAPVTYQGKPAAQVVLRNITERKRAEEALRESEVKYRTIVETANEGIWVVDADRRTTYVNDKMAEMLGCGSREVIGKSDIDFLDEEEEALSDRNIEERRQGVSSSYELKLIRRDKSPLWTFVNAVPLLDKNGAFAGTLNMLTDITERKRAEEEIKKHISELQAANEDLARFNRAAVDRELRMIELKKEVNELLRRTGQPPRYPLDFEKETP